MSNYQKISSFIWSIADDVLRGLFKPHEYGQVILPFTVLRRLDTILDPNKDEVITLYNKWKNKTDNPTPIILNKINKKFYNYSKFDLQRLTQDHQNIKKNFQNYLNGYSDNIFDIIENFQIDKHIEKLNKNNRLFLLIEKFASMDLSPETISNHDMGQIFEELLRKFSEISNETSGEHYTPRDVVKLLVALVFSDDTEKYKRMPVVSIFDCCCGTGGMLTTSRDWLKDNFNKEIKTFLFGQELNPETYAVCKSEMLITGDDPENIKYGDCLDNDQFKTEKFQFMIANPPYGESWKTAQKSVLNEFSTTKSRFKAGLPRISDGQLLFLQHLISKMDPEGSRIGIVFNGSPLFTGDAGNGESEIRKWLIENDLIEAIISLPDRLFFNTGIPTYFWILTNKKHNKRKNKIQILNGVDFYSSLRKNLGDKSKFIDDENIKKFINLYNNFKENEYCKIKNSSFFGYTKVTVEVPKKDKNGKIVKKKDKIVKDNNQKHYERIPLEKNIEEYLKREVYPNVPHAIIDFKKNQVGYEFNVIKYFYKHKQIRSVSEIDKEIYELEKQNKI